MGGWTRAGETQQRQLGTPLCFILSDTNLKVPFAQQTLMCGIPECCCQDISERRLISLLKLWRCVKSGTTGSSKESMHHKDGAGC